MNRNNEDGLVLTDLERGALALVLAAEALRPDASGAIEWEDVPELAESEFDRLLEAIAEVRSDLRHRALSTGLDPEYVWGQVR